jgi:hypothetical protein
MKIKNIITAIMLLLAAGICMGCSKEDEPKEDICECYFESPLTINDLPRWLLELMEQYKQGDSIVSISQCTYLNGMDGFLIDPCGECYWKYTYLYSWEGTELDNTRDNPDMYTKWDINIRFPLWVKY